MSQQQQKKVDLKPHHFQEPFIRDSLRTPSSMYRTAYEEPIELTSDQAINHVGGKNKFQIIAGFIAIFTYCSSGWIAYGLPYLYNKKEEYVKVRCFPPAGDPYLCGLEQACSDRVDHFEYVHDTSDTLVNWVVSFQIGCESQSTLNTLGSWYFGGYLTASLVFMILADFLGRKPIVLSGLILHILLNLAIIFVRNFYFLFAYITLIGLRTPMASHINYMSLVQQVSGDVRPYFSLLNNGFDGLGNTIVALVYCYIGNWYPWFIANTCIVFVLLLLQTFFMRESPRYLLARKKYKKAKNVYAFIAKVNKKQMFIEPLQGQTEHQAINARRESKQILASADVIIDSPIDSGHPRREAQQKKKGNILDLWRGKRCRERALLFIFPWCWLIADIVTYGISFSIGNLHGNIYYNGMIMGVSDLVSTLSLSFVANKLGRKKAWLLTWSLATIGSLLYDLIELPEGSIWSYVLLVIARLGASGSFGMCFLVTSQYFPTAFRGTVFAVCNAMARIGGVLSPLFQNWTSHFMLIFGVMSFSAFVLTFWVIETKGRGMADQIDNTAHPNAPAAATTGQAKLLERQDEQDEEEQENQNNRLTGSRDRLSEPEDV